MQILCVNMTVTQIKHYTQVYLWRCFSRWDGIPVGGLSRLPSSVWVGIIQPVSINQFSHSVVSNSLQPHGLQLARLPHPSPTPRVYSNSCHWVSDAIQPSHPLSSPSPPALNLSQHQGLFQWISSSHQVAKVLEFQLQYQSFQWIFRTYFL